MKKLFLILILTLTFQLLFSQYLFSQTQYEMTLTAGEELTKIDKELNLVYKKIRYVYSDDKVFLDNFKKSQIAWIKFRDLHLKALYPAEDPTVEYGSNYRMCYMYAAVEITKLRIDQISKWLIGVEEGDVCYGSMKRPNEIQEKLKSFKE
jgi:uncharacterized protein YecT (DUF1311 family)